MLIAFAGACHEVTAFELPPAPAGTLSALIFYETGEREGEAFAFEVAGRIDPFVGAPVSAIDVLYYPRSLSELGLIYGRQESAGEPNRALPETEHLFRSTREDLSRFQSESERSPAVAAKRIRALSPAECFALQGCYLSLEAGEEDRCTIPCGANGFAEAEFTRPQFECPPGWSSAERAGYAVCEPPARVEADCPIGQIQLIDAAGCTPLGAPCDANDPWNVTLSMRTGTVRYVQSGAPGGGLGTRERPFATISEAITAASAGDIIALSKGRHEGLVQIFEEVTLLGACPAETVIDGRGDLAVLVHVPGARLESLRIENARTAVDVRGALALENSVLLSEGSGTGVFLFSGASAQLDQVAARGWMRVVHRGFGAGALTVRRSVFLDSLNSAVFLETGGPLTVEDTVIGRGQLRAVEGSFEDGVEARLERVFFYSHRHQTINLSRSNSIVRDAVVRDTSESESYGNSLYQSFGAIEVSRSLFDHAAHAGLWIFDAEVDIRDIVVAYVDGSGLNLQATTSTVVRAAIVEAATGILLTDPGRAEISDVAVERSAGAGVFVSRDWIVKLSDARITGGGAGVEVVASKADLHNIHVSGVQRRGSGLALYGDARAQIFPEPIVTLDQFTIERCRGIGLDSSVAGDPVIKNGQLLDNLLGARIDFDPKKLERVEFRDNDELFERVGD